MIVYAQLTCIFENVHLKQISYQPNSIVLVYESGYRIHVSHTSY